VLLQLEKWVLHTPGHAFAVLLTGSVCDEELATAKKAATKKKQEAARDEAEAHSARADSGAPAVSAGAPAAAAPAGAAGVSAAAGDSASPSRGSDHEGDAGPGPAGAGAEKMEKRESRVLCASRRLNMEWKHVCYWGPAAVWFENVCGCGFVLAVGNNSVKTDILAVGTDVPMSKRLSGDFMTTCELLVQQVVTHAASKDPGKRTGLVSSTMRIPQIVVYANHGPNKGNAEYWISPSMCGSCRLWASDCCRSGVARTASDLYNIYSTKVLEKGDARTRRSYEEDIYHRMGLAAPSRGGMFVGATNAYATAISNACCMRTHAAWGNARGGATQAAAAGGGGEDDAPALAGAFLRGCWLECDCLNHMCRSGQWWEGGGSQRSGPCSTVNIFHG
jgi:hypothetical protein